MAANYKIFISHSWSYEASNKSLRKMLTDAPYFEFTELYIPVMDPVHSSESSQILHRAIKQKIDKAHAVIIMAGVYDSFKKWIDLELKISKKEYRIAKPIIAVQPWAGAKTSPLLRKEADAMVGWDGKLIAGTIKRLV